MLTQATTMISQSPTLTQLLEDLEQTQSQDKTITPTQSTQETSFHPIMQGESNLEEIVHLKQKSV